MKVLVTGGAGFIGSHIVDLLIEKGHNVTIYDNLDPQIHGAKREIPAYLNKSAEFIFGDVRDKEKLYEAVKNAEIIFHKAAAVGVGQSMYQIEHYVDVNTRGTAVLLDILVNKKNKVKKLIVAASMSSYGEGLYNCKKCGKVFPEIRTEKQLKEKKFELFCGGCGAELQPLPTDEEKSRDSVSIYAITKKDQEDMCLNIGNAYKIPTVALRYFNVYGQRQSVSNPYTGVVAIFASRLLNNNPPIIYEDGLQTRDFINVKDIAIANLLAMEKSEADNQYFNVGSGSPITVKNIAEQLALTLGKNIKPELVNKYRIGDVRHCFADINKIQKALGFSPSVNFDSGMKELCDWLKSQNAVDKVEDAQQELADKGLIV
ncbi:MAG TPA: SDR family NAD(P)-dependent oxidoreductase [bacterium]|nr:SDR family NAD(P)-dependent oxidoreductase [bacterium]HPN32417.1 SDR family NAD(P)-dependent oxidoreductase [bacterium]